MDEAAQAITSHHESGSEIFIAVPAGVEHGFINEA